MNMVIQRLLGMHSMCERSEIQPGMHPKCERSEIQPSIQNGIASDIITDIERYRSLLTVMKDRGDIEFYNKNKTTFNALTNRFSRFGRELE